MKKVTIVTLVLGALVCGCASSDTAADDGDTKSDRKTKAMNQEAADLLTDYLETKENQKGIFLKFIPPDFLILQDEPTYLEIYANGVLSRQDFKDAQEAFGELLVDFPDLEINIAGDAPEEGEGPYI